MQGGVGIYCRNGANRSPLGMIAFVMMVTGCSINEAICHVSSLRALTDIREPKYGNFVTPMKFLEKNEKYLKQLLAPKEQFCLPRTVKPDKFRAAWGTLRIFSDQKGIAEERKSRWAAVPVPVAAKLGAEERCAAAMLGKSSGSSSSGKRPLQAVVAGASEAEKEADADVELSLIHI